jgi:hypothetical protein
MNLKNKGFYESSVPVFSLLGNDENALSYSFAYFISKDINAYFLFIRNLGLNYKRSQNHYKNVLIEIQKRRKEGITDIEIKYENDYRM